MPRLSLSFLGTPRVEIDGKLIRINRRKAVALLAYLAVTQQRHSRDSLATLLWPEADQSRSRAALRSALWALNKTALEPWLLVEAETVTLGPSTGPGHAHGGSAMALDIDVIRFRDLLAAWQGHGHSVSAGCGEYVGLLTEAVSLYENDFLAGFTLPDAPAFDEWQFFQANSLRQGLATALQGLVECHGGQKDFGGAIPYARRLVALDPLHEPAQRTLMEVYARAGQQSAALRQYEICQKALRADLGLEPAEETRALYERIRSGAWRTDSDKGKRAGAEAGGAATGRKSRPPRIVNPHNLPPDPSSLVGRKEELARLDAFLEEPATRLLTITGPGGIGKTRLALAVAQEQVAKANFPDGIYFVPLAALSEPEAIIPAIAEATGYPFQADKRSTRQQVADFLSQKSILLLLDSFEHLLLKGQTDGALLVADFLQQAPHLRILVTSREPLNLYEEQRYPLQGLEIAENRSADADTDYAAAALFLQAVRRREPGFELVPADGAYLAEICRLVEGMPLALELAASWIEILSLREIAAEIAQNLDLMETSVRDIPARHRSMQAVFDRSWLSLSEREQKIYARLAVFRGGFTREAAKAVAEAPRQALAALVRKSLLRFDQRQQRYETHELLRHYAAAKLAEGAGEIRYRHAAYYAAFLQQRASDLKGRRQQQAVAEIEADHENAVAAWKWSVEQSQIANLDQALASLCLFYWNRSRAGEGEALCRLAIDRLAPILAEGHTEDGAQISIPGGISQTHLLAKLLTWQGYFSVLLGDYVPAREQLRRAQVVLDNLSLEGPEVTATRAFLLLHLSFYSIINEFGGQAKALNEASLALYRSVDDAWGTALALDALGQKNSNLGLHEQAIRQLEECLAIRQRLEDKQGIARSYGILGLVLLHTGQLEQSEAFLRKSLSIFRTMDNPAHLSHPLAVLGINLLFAGRFDESIASYEECWAIHKSLGIAVEPLAANVGMTRARINLGRYEEARRQALTDLASYRSSNHRWSMAFTLFNLGRIDLVEGATEQARKRLQESVEILQEMNARNLLPDALFCLAYALRILNRRRQAIQSMIQALKFAMESKPLNPMRFELPGMALLLADEGEAERAVEFYAAALQSPYIANSRWFEDIAGRRVAEIAAALPRSVVLAAQERGRARHLWTTANELLAELSRADLVAPT
jgi:predicted ATPase/DNA-binding SARP family transcriptional activator